MKAKIIKLCDIMIGFGFLAIIFFVPLVFDFTASSYNVFEIYKVVFFRLALTLILLAYAAKVFISGRWSYVADGKIFFPIFLLLVSFFLSSLFSLHQSESFWGSYLRQQGFYNLAGYLLFFILLVMWLRDLRQANRLAAAAVCSSALSALYGLVQFFNFDPFNWTENVLDTGRLFSTFGQPNFFGHFLILVLPLSFYWLFFQAKGFLARFFIFSVAAMEIFCLIFTYSRAAWLGFLSSLIFICLAWFWQKRRKKIVFGLLGLLSLVLAAVMFLNISQPASSDLARVNLASRLKSLVNFSSGSSKMRLFYLQAGFTEIKQENYIRLLFGYGPETLDSVFAKRYQPDWGIYEAINSFPDRAHNWPLDQILSFGFLGLAANLFFYFIFIRQAADFLKKQPDWQADSWFLVFCLAGLSAYTVNNLFSFSLVSHYIYLYLLLAIGWLVISRGRPEKTFILPLTVFSRTLISIFLLAACLIFAYAMNLRPLRAENYYIEAYQADISSDCGRMVGQIEQALNLSPNNRRYTDNYFFWLARCFPGVENKNLQKELAGLALLRMAGLKDQEFCDTQLNLARLYAVFGFYLDPAYYRQAQAIYEKLSVAYPKLTTVYEDWGRLKMYQSDYRSAIGDFQRAVSLLPWAEHPDLNSHHLGQIQAVKLQLYENLAQAYFKLGDYPSALDYYKQALKINSRRLILYKNIADIYYLKKDLDKAIQFNKRGLMLNPEDFNWPLSLSLLYREQHNLPAASEYLEQAIKLAPDNKELREYEKEVRSSK